MKLTRPDVFIIESLSPDDEGNGRFEGSSISHILRLHGKEPRYQYVRTREDFKLAVKKFGKSGYRYLHISAHADTEGMCTTNLDEISYGELSEILAPHLEGKRLFLSACSMVHEAMAAAIVPKTKCNSIVGPSQQIGFSTAAVFWPAVYHLMFSHNRAKMQRRELKENLKQVADLFNVDISYFASSKIKKSGFSHDLLSKK